MTINSPKHILLLLLGTLSLVSSCLPVGSKSSSRLSSNQGVSLSNGEGYVMLDNPIALTGNSTLSPSTNLNSFLSAATITENSFLTSKAACFGLSYCFEVRKNFGSSLPLQSTTGKWGFDASTSEFLQVNTFFHMQKIIDQVFSDLNFTYSLIFPYGTALYDSSFPYSVYKSLGNFQLPTKSPLISYADCDVVNNSYFSRTDNALCFGYFQANSTMKWAQDSSIIYHEMGHFLQHMLLNLRNVSSILAGGQNANMGNFRYDEAGAIGEGLSDYFSYYINKRTHFGEWAAGRILDASRPLSEDDSLHKIPLAKENGRRLSYPDYTSYNPNNETVPTEAIHYSGMIMSHFLVALTEDLVDRCGFTTTKAQTHIMLSIAEAMSELGDLTTTASANGTAGKVNLNTTRAFEWQTKVNPINFRSFTQAFSKSILNTLGNTQFNLCNNNIYARDYLESLLDQYGLLLFRTYNNHRNFADPLIAGKTNINVTSSNRNNSTLVSKSALIYNPDTPSNAFIIDQQNLIYQALTGMTSSGTIDSVSSLITAELPFNNGNRKANRGEVIGLALNLYNNSNTTMGGVQVLASDWKNLSSSGKPCIFSSSQSNDSDWITTSDGGELCSSITATESDFAPVCVVQSTSSSSTTWISQAQLRKNIALDKSKCLVPGREKDCFLRMIKGADHAYYSKIDAKKTWDATFQSGSTTPSFTTSNLIFLEISPNLPPNTTVDCRLRARFTNCDDCYHDSTRSQYDFTDTDYNGPKPFKVFHLQFDVTD